MKSYLYLRAYMAGITIPTLLLLFIMTAFTIARYGLDISVALERIIVFPMAIVPNLWGFWNILYVRLRRHRYLPIGFHGAFLAFVQAFLVFGVARLADFEVPEIVASVLPFGLPVFAAAFYLIWKHLVAFFNAVLGIDD